MNKKNESLKNTGLFLAFAGPAVFAFMAVVIIPFLYGFYLTFTSWDGLSKSKPFVGLANYAEVFKDTGFWQALGLTLIYVVVSVVLVNVVAFLLALLVTGKLRGKKFFRAGFFVPNLIGGIVLGYIWQFIFKTILVYIGKNAGIGFLSKSWLSSPVPRIDRPDHRNGMAAVRLHDADLHRRTDECICRSARGCQDRRMYGEPGDKKHCHPADAFLLYDLSVPDHYPLLHGL